MVRHYCNCVHMNDDVPLERHACGCGIRSKAEQVASYGYIDLPDGNRLHEWIGPPRRFAIGIGPIKTISREEAVQILDRTTYHA